MLNRRSLLVGAASVAVVSALPSVGAANVQPHAKLKMFWSELRDAGIESSFEAPMPDAIERMNAVATRFFGSLPVSFIGPADAGSRLVTLYPARLNPNRAMGSDVAVASFPVTIEGMGDTAHPFIRMS